MKNASFGAGLEAASREFVEAFIIATDTIEAVPPQDREPQDRGIATAEGETGDPKNEIWEWRFQINPSSIRHSIGAQYNDAQTWAAKTPDSQFFSSTAETMEIQGAIFDTWHEGLSLEQVLVGMRDMIQPNPSKGIFHPPILTFVWGENRFGPCVLTQISWDEVAWLGGMPATMQVNLSFKRLPTEREEVESQNPLLLPQNTDTSESPNRADPSSPAFSLTDNQKRQASQYARAHLLLNRDSYSPEVQQALQSNRYLLLTDAATGEVKMLNPDGSLIGAVFRWNGSTGSDARFVVDGISTIPTAPNRKPRVFEIEALEAVK